MNIEIRKLMPEHAEEYVKFFDITPHDDNIDEHKCYCVCWSDDYCEVKDFSSVENSRNDRMSTRLHARLILQSRLPSSA